MIVMLSSLLHVSTHVLDQRDDIASLCFVTVSILKPVLCLAVRFRLRTACWKTGPLVGLIYDKDVGGFVKEGRVSRDRA